jgi:hypothetical protein
VVTVRAESLSSVTSPANKTQKLLCDDDDDDDDDENRKVFSQLTLWPWNWTFH